MRTLPKKPSRLLLFFVIPCIAFALTLSTPQDVYADKICKKIEKRVVNLAKRITKFIGPRILGKFSAKYIAASPNFLKEKDLKARNQLQSSIDYAQNTCGSIDTYCPWTCWNAQWPMPTECRQCWFEYDGSPTGCDYSYRQTVLGWIKDRNKYNAIAVKVEGRLIKGYCRKHSKYERFLAILDTLVNNCSLERPTLGSPPSTPTC